MYESVLEKLIIAFLARQPDAQMDTLKAVLDTLETSGEDNDMCALTIKSHCSAPLSGCSCLCYCLSSRSGGVQGSIRIETHLWWVAGTS